MTALALASFTDLTKDLGQGTLVSLEVRKKGRLIGGKVYDDDFVHVIIWAGFYYRDFVLRSQRKLQAFRMHGTDFERDLLQKTQELRPDITPEEIRQVILETATSYQTALSYTSERNPYFTREEKATKDWTPLKIDGKRIPGVKVFTGPGPENGSVYVQGIKLGQKVLIPAPNGHWTPKSAPKTIAKEVLRSLLPFKYFRQYRLSAETVLTLEVGERAEEALKWHDIQIDAAPINLAFRV